MLNFAFRVFHLLAVVVLQSIDGVISFSLDSQGSAVI